MFGERLPYMTLPGNGSLAKAALGFLDVLPHSMQLRPYLHQTPVKIATAGPTNISQPTKAASGIA